MLVQPGFLVPGEAIGEFRCEAQAKPGRDFIGKVRGAATLGRRIDMQLESEFAGLVDVVGIDLDFVTDRKCRRSAQQRGQQQGACESQLNFVFIVVHFSRPHCFHSN